MCNRLPASGRQSPPLFPAVKALGQGLAAKIFYLTAKTPGRLIAESALDDMRQANLKHQKRDADGQRKDLFLPAGKL
jgi:DNA excision repair protein ERCC-2